MALDNDSPQIKVLKVLINNEGTANTKEIRKAIGCNMFGLHSRIEPLIRKGLIKKEVRIIKKKHASRESIFRIDPKRMDNIQWMLDRSEKIEKGLICRLCAQEIPH